MTTNEFWGDEYPAPHEVFGANITPRYGWINTFYDTYNNDFAIGINNQYRMGFRFSTGMTLTRGVDGLFRVDMLSLEASFPGRRIDNRVRVSGTSYLEVLNNLIEVLNNPGPMEIEHRPAYEVDWHTEMKQYPEIFWVRNKVLSTYGYTEAKAVTSFERMNARFKWQTFINTVHNVIDMVEEYYEEHNDRGV